MKEYKDGDERTIYEDESFGIILDVELKDGTYIGIHSRKHFINEVYEDFYDGEWERQEVDEVDYFYLTRDEKRFNDEDVSKFFDLDNYFGQYDDSNGWSGDYCGINETDDHEKSLEKFKNYKLKFEKVTSKDQFDIEK